MLHFFYTSLESHIHFIYINTLTDEETALSPQMLNTIPKNSQPVSEQDALSPSLTPKSVLYPHAPLSPKGNCSAAEISTSENKTDKQHPR